MSTSRLLVALAALLAAGPGLAQQNLDVPLPPPPAGTGRLAAAPAAPPRAGRAPGWIALAAGPYAAFERGQSLGLVLDYGFDATPPRWTRWQLEWHLAVGLSRPSEDTALTREEAGLPGEPALSVPAGIEDASAYVATIVPTARLRRELAPGFAVVLDGGAGLSQTVERYERDEMFVGRSEQTKNVTGLALRLGAGISVDLGARVRLLFVPLAVDFLVGADWSGFSPSMGLAFRL